MTLWETALEHLFKAEGGYVNHPDDPGGETNFGISKRSYPHLNIRALTKAQAAEIYRRDYWEKIPATLPDGMRWMVFDAAVNHGVGRALEWLEVNHDLVSYAATRLRFYAGLGHFDTFGRGWVRRVANLLDAIGAWYQSAPPARAETVVFNGFGSAPIVIRGEFLWRTRGTKIDITRATPAEE